MILDSGFEAGTAGCCSHINRQLIKVFWSPELNIVFTDFKVNSWYSGHGFCACSGVYVMAFVYESKHVIYVFRAFILQTFVGKFACMHFSSMGQQRQFRLFM